MLSFVFLSICLFVCFFFNRSNGLLEALKAPKRFGNIPLDNKNYAVYFKVALHVEIKP